MRFFTKEEFFVVLGILTVIVSISLYNFRISIRRARDAQRKSDLNVIGAALNKYNEDLGIYPFASLRGEIIACEPTRVENGRTIFSPCIWGKDSFSDIATLPLDPRTGQGMHYIYISSGKNFQLYSSFEGDDEAEYNPSIVNRKISCGIKTCSFGVASGKTPLEKSIEEYENEINVQK